MGIQFECHYCHAVFPAEKRIDGYSQGYKVGFLCPQCGKNIKDNLLTANQRLNKCQRKWLTRLFWLFIPVFVSRFFDCHVEWFGKAISLEVILLGISVLVAGLVLLFVPCTRKAGVFVTEPVDEK